MSNFLCPCGLSHARILCPWDSLGKNTGVGFHAFFQGTFLTQRLNPHLLCHLHCKRIFYPQNHLRNPIFFYRMILYHKNMLYFTLSFYQSIFLLFHFFAIKIYDAISILIPDSWCMDAKVSLEHTFICLKMELLGI